MKKYLLGLDVGGTKIECALLEVTNEIKNPDAICFSVPEIFLEDDSKGKAYGHILARNRILTERKSGYEIIINNIKKLCLDVCNSQNVAFEKIDGIGIGLPGTVDPLKQVMVNGNTAVFIGKDIAQDLNKLFPNEVKIILDNDASCFALAEVICGAGVDHYKQTDKNVLDQVGIGIILGTGTGGGIIIHSRVLRGRNGAGGELGHTELITNGHPCYCGKNGCAEQYISGTALEASFASRRYSQIQELPGSKEIFELALSGEPLAIAVVKQFKRHLGKFLANLTNIFDPDYFVLGGGVSNRDEIYEGLEEAIASNSFVDVVRPKVYKHQLGDSSGVIGAAMLLLGRQDI